MKRAAVLVAFSAILVGCHTVNEQGTIGELRHVKPDTSEVAVDDSLVKAMAGYRQFLAKTPDHAMAPEAMRRLADLEIEKDYGVVGGNGIVEMAAPDSDTTGTKPKTIDASPKAPSQALTAEQETDADFERRTTARHDALVGHAIDPTNLPEGAPTDLSGPRQAIATYKKILTDYPWYERNDQVLYQMARAYEELADPDEAMHVVDRLIAEYPNSKYLDEVYFRRGEYFFVRRKYLDAENAYKAVVAMGEGSEFYELSLYKLGWSLYKQEMYEEALTEFIALLDFKLSTGYDFDAHHDEDDERRVADTFRVVSLSFTALGGPEVLQQYFAGHGERVYEDRIYQNLAEFHFDKRRYTDAAAVYQAFVKLHPYHKQAPHFSMRTAAIYTEGNFPLLVVKAKRDFAERYGVKADYWHYFDMDSMPDVRDYLKTDLIDLANHYHALYQQQDLADDKPANYAEASRWYREFLTSFPQDDKSPSINYQFADLLLENKDFGQAAIEYEHTAYGYPAHERAAAAGYAAIYAHREELKVIAPEQAPAARLATVESSLKFAATFPDHEHAAAVLGAAADDLYDMKDFERAITTAQTLIDRYPAGDPALRRTAWLVVAHSNFDLARYPDAEHAYTQALALMAPDDEKHQATVDNLAASIYKQGEQARDAGDYASAADNFLRIKAAAPTSEIRAAAEYDGAAALIHLEDWQRSAEVLEDFRKSFPDDKLVPEATRQLANVYEKAGELAQSASEYERVAGDAKDAETRREAILVAGDLYERSNRNDDALRIYLQYIDEFREPLDQALETRSKVANMYKQRGDDKAYREQLTQIVAIDAGAGAGRTDRSRYLAANAALVLDEPLYDDFAKVALVQPFKRSLAEKQRRMDKALAAFEALPNYEVGEVTAAATFYIAETYRNFSKSLANSERPTGLSADELADYEDAIEEQAYPFEERAIEVHEKNLELMHSSGVFNDWIQHSLDALAQLVPGRYAKPEISGGYIGTVEQYAYRAPVAPQPVAEQADASAAPPAPTDQPEQAGSAPPADQPAAAAAQSISPDAQAAAGAVAPAADSTPANGPDANPPATVSPNAFAGVDDDATSN
jgi:tetratricopeptide (TPR) repeat protein